MSIDQYKVDQDASQWVMKTLNHFKDLRTKMRLETQWTNFEKAYNNDVDSFYKGIAQVRIPALHQSVERIVPKMDKVLFPPDGDFFSVTPKRIKDDVLEAEAEAFTILIKQQLLDSSIRSKMIPVYRSLCIYGTVFVKTYWNYRKKQIYKRVNGKRTPIYETVADYPDFYSPSIWDIFIDPKDVNLEGALIERMVVDYQVIRNKRVQTINGEVQGIYRNTDQIKEMRTTKELDSERKASDRAKSLTDHEYGSHEHKVIVYQYWGSIPKYFLTRSEKDFESGEMQDNCLVEVASGAAPKNDGIQAVTMRIDDNPFDHQDKPYLRGRYLAVDGMAYGLGVMSVNIPLQAELNTLRQQLLDMRTFMLRRKWKLDRNAGVNAAQLEDIDNLVIEMDDLNGLEEVKQTDFSASALTSDSVIKQDIDDSTGASKLLGGTPERTSLERTAAGVATVVQGGLERFELVVTQFEEDIMKPLIKHFWSLDQQYLSEGAEIEMVGRGLVNVDPSLIDIPQFNFNGTKEIGEKGIKINALNILLQNVMPFAQVGIDPVPILLRFIKVLGMGDLIPDIDKRPESSLEDTPEGEVQLLAAGRKVKINLTDNHPAFIQAYVGMVGAQLDVNSPTFLPDFLTALRKSGVPENIQRNILEATAQRIAAMAMKTSLSPEPTKENI